MRCEAQIARFWLRRRRVSHSLRAHSQTRKHWVENGRRRYNAFFEVQDKTPDSNTRQFAFG